MNETFKGILAMVTACTIWGLSPLYYNLLSDVPPLEILSHRTMWSCVLLFTVLVFQRRMGELMRLMSSPRQLVWVVLAGVMISINWFTFIYSVQIGRVVESSLGYYIFPLMAVALGAIFLGERLSRTQYFAVALAAVAVLTLTIGLGVAPYISLILGFTFGIYGLLKKQLAVGPVLSVTTEMIFLLPLALIWLWGAHTHGWVGVGSGQAGVSGLTGTMGLLILSGPLTAIPLMMMTYAARRLKLATVGLIQYVNPTLQFLVATLIFTEVFTTIHLIAFTLIWVGLAIYTMGDSRRT
jgi:chloramphenicol-sensitive protein RarD